MVFIDDGLGDKAQPRYQNRRNKLAQKTQCLTIILSPTNSAQDLNTWDHYTPQIYQDPLMLHLTGINQLKTALILDPQSPKNQPKEILFLPKKDPKLEFWTGTKLSYSHSLITEQTITGIKDIRDISTLDQFIISRLKNKESNICIQWQQNKNKKKIIKDYNYQFRNHLKYLLKKHSLPKTTIINIATITWQIRNNNDQQAINSIINGNKINGEILTKLLKKARNFKTETNIASFLDGEIANYSYLRNSFSSIVAAGRNATILHYTKNNELINPNSLVLLDFGIRTHSMNTDISRTFPISGKFNILQRIIYQIILDTQNLIEKNASPKVSIQDLDKICWDFINSELEKQLISKGCQVLLPYKYAPHKVSHLLGLAVHDGDPFGEYRNDKLKPGWIISNEPGVYGRFSMEIDGKEYSEFIGVRIEDNLLITKTGCQNLSTTCPKTINDIESIMSKL
jgi:Xaa-Pro aminopeptidase